MTEPLLTVRDLTEILKVDEITVQTWTRNGVIKGFRLNGTRGPWRYHRADIDEWLAKQRNATTETSVAA